MIKYFICKIHKHFSPIGYAKSLGVKLGQNCRLIDVEFGSEPYLVTLGDHVSATGTYFVTHDGGVWVFRDKDPNIDIFAPIKVGNNVFFGLGCIVLPGVTIGDNVVVGAGSIVTKDIPSNVVAAGVPAKVIKDLSSYYSSVKKRCFDTKLLSKEEKKSILLEHFSKTGK